MVIAGANNKLMATHSLEDVLHGCSKSQQQQQEKKPRPHPETALKCPRCDSTNTKFCYYNNYSLSQPRYFCKGCRRYWTKGGSLRNVPVGGSCRKNKKSSSSSSKRTQDQPFITTNPNTFFPTLPPPPPPSLPYNPSDHFLAFERLHNDSFLIGNPNPSSSYVRSNNASTGFLDILRNGFLDNTAVNPNYFHTVYNGFGEGMEHCTLGFDESLLGSSVTTAATITTTATCTGQDGDLESKVVMGLQWQLGGDHGNTSLDSSGLECWNNGVGSSWHGLISSSLI